MNDETLTATHVTPTESGRWLVFIEGVDYPVSLLDELPTELVVIVEAECSFLFDPTEVCEIVDTVQFAPVRRSASRIAA